MSENVQPDSEDRVSRLVRENELLLADRKGLVRYVRAQRNYLGERYLDRAPHFIVTEHEEAYEALSQELRDEIEDGGEKTDQS